MSAPFTPQRHIVNLRGKDYLEVKWRLVWLRSAHPDAAIDTELVRFDPPAAVFRARITIPGHGSATGWGQEEAADFSDYLEKAETKAIGRALAALGFGTQFAVDLVPPTATAGSRIPPAPHRRTPSTHHSSPATDEQRRTIATLCTSLGMVDESAAVPLTSAQAGAIIRQLTTRMSAAARR